MFTISEFDRIHEEFKARQSERRQIIKKVWSILLAVTSLLIALFIILFPNQFDSSGTAWILPTYGGIAFLIPFIGLLVSMNFISEKPVYEYLYDEIIRKINMDEGLFLEYKAYDKENVEFNKIGGLFTRYANVRVKRHISGDNEEHQHFNIYDCTMTTSSGNSQQTHFDGVYFVLNRKLNTSIQIRTNGSPKLKGVKFIRQEGFEGLKVYKEIDQNMNNIDHQFLTFVTRLSEYEEYKRVYFSIVDNQIHLALWYRKHPTRKPKTITVEKLNSLATYFMTEYQMINNIAQVDNY